MPGSYIVADASVLAGKPIIKGARLSDDFLLSLLAAGWTEQQIFDIYPQISADDLKAVFDFAQPETQSKYGNGPCQKYVDF